MRALPALALLAAFALAAPPAQAQDRDLGVLARQIVETADVQPGDAVGVFGGQHTLPLMEAITMEADRRGGRTMMVLDTDAVQEAFWTRAPESALTRRDLFLDVGGMLDVYIGLPGLEDPDALQDVPAERFAIRQAQNAADQQEIMGFRFRGVFVGYPSEGAARVARVPLRDYEAQHWAALAADYDAVSASAERVGRALQGAERVRVTTPAGTDFTFAVGDRQPFLDDGRITAAERASGGVVSRFVSLPGGSVDVAGQETSAQGRVMVRKDLCNGDVLRDVQFRFEDGVMNGFQAGAGRDCYEQEMAPYSGPKDRFGGITIGLNPERRVVESGDAEYRPSDAAGMVWLRVGDNTFFGGANQGTTGFSFPLTNATVEADGRVIVRDGRLVES